MHVILNLSGEGLVIAPSTRLTLLPHTLALFRTPEISSLLTATRFATSQAHDFLLLTLTIESVEKSFGPLIGGLRKNLGILRRWSEREAQFFNDIVSPPVPEAAKKAWYLAIPLVLHKA